MIAPKYPPEGKTYKQAKADGSLVESSVWWVKYYVNGRARRESTGTPKETEARRFLKLREGAAAAGAPLPPRLDHILYDELVADLREHYKTTGAGGSRKSKIGSSTWTASSAAGVPRASGRQR